MGIEINEFTAARKRDTLGNLVEEYWTEGSANNNNISCDFEVEKSETVLQLELTS